MALKLIHSSVKDPVHASNARALLHRRAFLWSMLIFFAVKFPMCFVTNNPEELRDYDHYVRMSQGEMAYRDYVWIYGPVTPLVYGAVLKIFPHRLITVRLFSFALWMVGAAFLSLLLGRYFKADLPLIGGTIFASAIFGYPSYSHNHVLVAVSMIAACYFFVCFVEERYEPFLFASFGAVMICLFSRPVVTGYGVFAGWLTLLCLQKKYPDRYRMLVVFLAGSGIIGLSFFLIYGLPVANAFVPRDWAIVTPKAYPSLRNLLVHINFNDPVLTLKQLRAALETCVFYLHYFIWPTLILTTASIYRYRSSLKAATICCGLALIGSLDLLHYGFESPQTEQAMMVRGQYFFALTAVSIFLVAWPTIFRWRESKIHAVGALALIAAISGWSLFPWATGMMHLASYPVNPHGFEAMQGIVSHPDRAAVFDAVAFTNTLCRSEDSVVLPQYDPGIQNLLKCKDLFGQDAYAFTRMPWYTFVPGENPYVPQGGITSAEFLKTRIEANRPKFYIVESVADFKVPCESPGWLHRDFLSGPSFRRVCWNPSAS